MNAAVIRNAEVNPVMTFNSRKKLETEQSAQNAKYLSKLDRSLKEIEEGKIVEVSAEEMRRILSE